MMILLRLQSAPKMDRKGFRQMATRTNLNDVAKLAECTSIMCLNWSLFTNKNAVKCV